MISTLRLLATSAIAPLALTLPGLVFAVFVAHGLAAGEDSQRRFFIGLAGGTLTALVCHVALMVLYAVTTLALRALGLLSRRALFASGLVAAMAVSTWLAAGSLGHMSQSEVLEHFAIQFVVNLIVFTLLSALWWHIASRRPKAFQAGRASSAA